MKLQTIQQVFLNCWTYPGASHIRAISVI